MREKIAYFLWIILLIVIALIILTSEGLQFMLCIVAIIMYVIVWVVDPPKEEFK
jgi:hypothetical protein